MKQCTWDHLVWGLTLLSSSSGTVAASQLKDAPSVFTRYSSSCSSWLSCAAYRFLLVLPDDSPVAADDAFWASSLIRQCLLNPVPVACFPFAERSSPADALWRRSINVNFAQYILMGGKQWRLRPDNGRRPHNSRKTNINRKFPIFEAPGNLGREERRIY